MSELETGLDRLLRHRELQKKIKGNIAYLGHSAAVTKDLELGLSALIKIFGKRVIKAFGPQHGFVTDVQDNMVETESYHHPYFNIPLYSLYGKTRTPLKEMLEGIDTLLIDLQDVGTRVYTYITTMSLVMEACAQNSRDIDIVILDRPNPVGGLLMEGPILAENWRSFVGHHPIPQRHALTMGEMARLNKEIHAPNINLKIIEMKGWKRKNLWWDLKRPWINPSPNLPTPESALLFCGTVLFEGTNISEGRGTTRSLEILGAPWIEPFSFASLAQRKLREAEIENIILRPLQFLPMFQKYEGTPCGGIQLHPTDFYHLQSWKIGMILLREFYHSNPSLFQWNNRPYEYEEQGLAIDFINGSKKLRYWVEKKGTLEELHCLTKKNWSKYLDLRENALLYS